MKGVTHVNLVRKNGHVHILKNSLESVCVGRLGCPGEIVSNLREYLNVRFLLKSKLRSRRIIRQGYSCLPRSELKKIYRVLKNRGHWGLFLEV